MEFLKAIGSSGTLIGLDADADNLERARERLEPWKSQTKLIHANFREIPALGLPQTDIIFADLGLSSPHLDDPERGFTFRENAPLDMRLDRMKGESAAELLANSTEEELAYILDPDGYVVRQGLQRHAFTLTFSLTGCQQATEWRSSRSSSVGSLCSQVSLA